MIVIGITGGIATGKSTVSKQIKRLGVTSYNADHVVHRLLGPQGDAVERVAAAFPGVKKDQSIDRTALAERVFADAGSLQRLEQILHPLVRREEEKFIQRARRRRLHWLALEIPLLFETAGEERCDAVIVTTAPSFLQRQRVLARPAMTATKFTMILARQLPQHLKMHKAHFIVPTGLGFAYSFRRVATLFAQLKRREKQKHERNRARYGNHGPGPRERAPRR